MKKLTSIIFTLLVISSSPGHCSYRSDYKNAALAYDVDDNTDILKCFMIIDMIDNSKNEEEKKRLKTRVGRDSCENGQIVS